MEKTYKVTIELEVTTDTKDKALVYAVADITELSKSGSLDAKVVEVK